MLNLLIGMTMLGGIALLPQFRPQVALLDYRMPGLDGAQGERSDPPEVKRRTAMSGFLVSRGRPSGRG